METGADATGWFYREAGGAVEARQQYFVLRDEVLHCYDSRDATLSQGRLRLANDTQLELGGGSDSEWLSIKCGSKEWRLRCGDPGQLRSFRDAVQIASDSSTRTSSSGKSRRGTAGKVVHGVWIPCGTPWVRCLCGKGVGGSLCAQVMIRIFVNPLQSPHRNS